MSGRLVPASLSVDGLRPRANTGPLVRHTGEATTRRGDETAAASLAAPASRLRAGSLTLPVPEASANGVWGTQVFSSGFTPTQSGLPSPAVTEDERSLARLIGQEQDATAADDLAEHLVGFLGLHDGNTPTVDRQLIAAPTQSMPAEAGRLRAQTLASALPRASHASTEDTTPSRRLPALLDISEGPRPRAATLALFQGGGPGGQTRSLESGGLALEAPELPDFTSDTASNGWKISPPDLASANTTPHTGPVSAIHEHPTRSLWVGAVAPSACSQDLLRIFSAYGPIESLRVLAHKQFAFVNYDKLEDAIRARKLLNGREIYGPEFGPVKINFGKPLKPSPAVQTGYLPGPPLQDPASAPAILEVSSTPADLQLYIRRLSPDDPAVEDQVAALAALLPPASYYSSVPPPPQALGPWGETAPSSRRSADHRHVDHPRLRLIRQQLDGTLSVDDVDALVNDLLEDAHTLATHFEGNLIIQAFFEQASRSVRLALLRRLAPHLAAIGCHKHGTWACQKIIELASTPEELSLICHNLAPWVPGLLLHELGNYCVSACLKFGAPRNDFVVAAICNRCWTVAEGRFGARATRTILESSHITAFQRKRIVAAIIQNAVPLATSANGSLVLNHVLDAADLSGRFGLLAQRFVPHLAHLMTHKLGSTVVMRCIHQGADPAAAAALVDAFFFTNAGCLADILSDEVHGVSIVLKLLSCIDGDRRTACIAAVQQAMDALAVSGVPAYSQLERALTGRGELVRSYDTSPSRPRRLPHTYGTPRTPPLSDHATPGYSNRRSPAAGPGSHNSPSPGPQLRHRMPGAELYDGVHLPYGNPKLWPPAGYPPHAAWHHPGVVMSPYIPYGQPPPA